MGKILDRFDDYLVRATVMYISGADEHLHYIPDVSGEDADPVRTSEVFDAFEKGIIIIDPDGNYVTPVKIEEQDGEACAWYITPHNQLISIRSFPDLVE